MAATTRTLLAVGVLGVFSGVTFASTTVTFQNGVGDYLGGFDARIGYNMTNQGTAEEPAYDGFYVTGDALVNQYSTDEDHPGGWYVDGTRPSGNSSANYHGVMQFNDIIGDAMGQIPAGARILSATLEVTTGTTTSNNRSGGRWAVGAMLEPTTVGTTWLDYAGGDGLWPRFGATSYNESNVIPADNGGTYSFSVKNIVQQWSNGADNYGFHIDPSTTDGWYYLTSANEDTTLRPKLTVEYDMGTTTTHVFQNGLNGYDGTTDVRVNAEFGADFGVNEQNVWLDGESGGGEYAGLLLHFDDLFGSGSSQYGVDDAFTEAYVVLTTTGLDVSYNSMSGGTWALSEMAVEWDVTGTNWSLPLLYDDFGGDGPDVEDGELVDEGVTVTNIARNQEAWFEVTDIVKGWQLGEDNNGLYVYPQTTDGWNIFATGSDDISVRPRLVLVNNSPVEESIPGDFNGDGSVDLLDLSVLATNFDDAGTFTFEQGDANGDGVVDLLDLSILAANFGTSSVPEPASLALVALGGLALVRRK